MPQPLDYHAHHAAFGAYGSFTLGALGAGGGFNIHDGRKPCTDEVYVGYARASEGFRLLPFSRVSHADLSAFATDSGARSGLPCRAIRDESVSRRLGWGTDTWETEDARDKFRLSIATPFGNVPDPRRHGWEAAGPHLIPAVWAELEFDNSRSDEDALVVFGVGGGDTGVAPLELPGAIGIARQGREGFASPIGSGARPFCGFSLESCFSKELVLAHPHWLGAAFGLCWKVPAGAVGRFPLSIAWYVDGAATTGIATRYAYTRIWNDLDAVLTESVARHDKAFEAARELDERLEASRMSAERGWMLAHATRGYFGSTQVLSTVGGDPVCVVNEGEYCMMNTLDLSVDQAFFESMFFPWFSREVLDLFADRYHFMDDLKVPGETRIHHGGISFCHDMGVRNRFAAPGSSSYELPDLEGCFSHMTFEQACNWVLVAGVHHAATADRAWCEGRQGLFEGLLESLERREHPDPRLREGTPGTDSARCGAGTEITTYDSLDPSLAQTRRNLYTTVKLWAAYLALERLFGATGDQRAAERAAAGARRVADTVERWPERDGILPAIADGRNASAILPAVEGLVYPLFWGDDDAISHQGRYGAMVRKLGGHLDAVVDSGICRFPDGGWRISSTSDNSWLSKIWIAQRVAEKVFGRRHDAIADAAHVAWLSPGSSCWGFCDQIIDGKAIGSKYYPRGVTSALFLD